MTDTEQQDFFDRITLELNSINPDVYVAKNTVDDNWQALKQERLQPYVEPAVIEKISNVSLMLWANDDYTDGNFQCDVYTQGTKQHYNKNLIFEVTPDMTPRQYKVWDLVKTDAHLSGCMARRAKFYNKDDAKDYSAEFAHFEIWRGNDLIWACLLVEDWLIPMNVYIETYLERGNMRLTAPWKHRQLIDDWYKENI
jgi:hypothetical protein